MAQEKTKSITKFQLIQVIADRCDLTQMKVARVLEVLTDVVGEALYRDHIIQIANLVQFQVKTLAARDPKPGWDLINNKPSVFGPVAARYKVVAKPMGRTKTSMSNEVPK